MIDYYVYFFLLLISYVFLVVKYWGIIFSANDILLHNNSVLVAA